MLLFIALGQRLVGVPPLQTAEFSGIVLIAFAKCCGLIGHPNCNNEPDRLSDLPDMVIVVAYAEPSECNVVDLVTPIELQAFAWRRIPSQANRTDVGRALP